MHGNAFGGIGRPYLYLTDQPSFQYIFILDLIHHAIHDVKTICTPFTDERTHHYLKWVFEGLFNRVWMIFFAFSVHYYLYVRLVGETNLKNFKISSDEYCEALKMYSIQKTIIK